MSEEDEAESGSILPISQGALREDILHTHIYPEMAQVYYWSEDWEPDFYVALARAGFISISFDHPELGPLLIPEMQKSYAVLDWGSLHVSRKLRKLMRSQRLEQEGIELHFSARTERVVERLLSYHAPNTWLTLPYRELLTRLPTGFSTDFSMHAVELWSRARKQLIAGEIGYTLGRTYTSLSGFCMRPDPEWRHFGTLQQLMLASRLEDCGYAFWNMGDPSPPYKTALGARILPRDAFLSRWIPARQQTPRSPLS